MILPSSQTTSVEIILSEDRKTILETAAILEGLTLSEYLVKIATYLAEQSILQYESITLSNQDWEIVTSKINNPPEINNALKKAISRYKQNNLE